MKERRFKFKLYRINVCKSYKAFALPLFFDYHPPGLKCKYGHWRLEFGESLIVHFLWWNAVIYFNNRYWEEICKKRNNEAT